MTETLPAYDIWNGHAATLDICEPCWLYAGRLTSLDGDQDSWRFTYCSPILRPGDPLYQRMLDFLNGALPIGEPEIVTDPEMMFGQAVLTLFELRPLDLTA